MENFIKNYQVFLTIEKYFVEQNFNWLKLELKDKILFGNGSVNIGNKNYCIEILYSPFYPNRFDRIFIRENRLEFNDKIHLYRDMSLCLYHPIIDKPLLGFIPLYKMIPWISEWIIHYNEWKKYGVWLGKEIKH